MRGQSLGLLCREPQADPDHGCHNGIGLAAAEALAALGANLAIVGRSETKTRLALARDELVLGLRASKRGWIAACPVRTSR